MCRLSAVGSNPTYTALDLGGGAAHTLTNTKTHTHTMLMLLLLTATIMLTNSQRMIVCVFDVCYVCVHKTPVQLKTGS